MLTSPHHCSSNAFDILALDIARLLARWPDGIFISPFEQGEIGPDLAKTFLDRGAIFRVRVREDIQIRRRLRISHQKSYSGPPAVRAIHKRQPATAPWTLGYRLGTAAVLPLKEVFPVLTATNIP